MSINRKIRRKQEQNTIKDKEIDSVIANAKKLIITAKEPKAFLSELLYNIVESEETKDDIAYVKGIYNGIENVIPSIEENIKKLELLVGAKRTDKFMLDAVETIMEVSEKCLLLEDNIRKAYTVFKSLEEAGEKNE